MSELIVKFHHDERGTAISWEETGKIIRCKDCKHWEIDGCKDAGCLEDDFCSYAERRGDSK